MTIVCAFIEKYDSSNNLLTRKWSPIIEADVLLAGERSLDYGTFTFPASTAVTMGDTVKYIQDIVDTNFLYGIWNWQDSLRDESGYDQDGTAVNTTARYLKSGGSTYLKYGNLLNDQVKINDSTVPKAVIDFSAQFDIIMLLKPDIVNATGGTAELCFFSKSDLSTSGIEVGINAGSSPQYIHLELYSGSILTQINGSNQDLRDGNFHWIRIKRDENNLLTITVDGISEYSSTYAGDLTNSNNLVIGNNASNGGKHYSGLIGQTRIYCGGYLQDKDYNIVIGARQQPLTMKFAGMVWQNKSDSATKDVQVKAFSQILQDIQPNISVANNIFTNSTYSSIISSLASTYMNGWQYINDQNALAGDLVVTVGGVTKTLTTDYTIAVNTSTNPYTYTVTSVTAFASGASNVKISYYSTDGTLVPVIDTFSGSGSIGQVCTLSKVPNFLTGYYVATDTLLANLTIFTTLNNAFFMTTARKMLIAESRNQDHTDILFTNGKRYVITGNGSDATALVNDLEVIGGNQLTNTTETFTGNNTVGQNITLTHIPFSYTVKVSSVLKILGVDYTVNNLTGVITFLKAIPNSASNISVNYYYEGTNYTYRLTDSASILDNGATYSKSITLPQISDLTLITAFATAYIAKYKNKSNRYTINAPFFVNSVRPNYQVTVTNPILGLNAATETIVSMEYKYPACTTTILVGDFLYDSYDLGNATQIKVNQTYTTAVKTTNT